MSKIFYGLSPEEKLDVTIVAVENCIIDLALIIPMGDPQRAELFRIDPYEGQLKRVYIESPEGVLTTYDHMTPVDIPNFS